MSAVDVIHEARRRLARATGTWYGTGFDQPSPNAREEALRVAEVRNAAAALRGLLESKQGRQ